MFPNRTSSLRATAFVFSTTSIAWNWPRRWSAKLIPPPLTFSKKFFFCPVWSFSATVFILLLGATNSKNKPHNWKNQLLEIFSHVREDLCPCQMSSFISSPKSQHSTSLISLSCCYVTTNHLLSHKWLSFCSWKMFSFESMVWKLLCHWREQWHHLRQPPRKKFMPLRVGVHWVKDSKV